MAEANNNTVNGEQGNGQIDDGSQGNSNNIEKTYTETEVNSMINGAIGRKMKDMPSKEELKAFKDWQSTQKTEEEKVKEREKEYQNTLNELNSLKTQSKLSKAKVKEEFSEFVASKLQGFNDDFDTELEKFKKENPQYFGDTLQKKVSTGANIGGTTVDEEDQKIRKLMGLPLN